MLTALRLPRPNGQRAKPLVKIFVSFILEVAMFDKVTVGTCGVCGGPVQVPSAWWGVVPPQKQCSQCGAVAVENYGPVLPMQPLPNAMVDTKTSTNMA